jgi:toxin ParE1/3/4
MRRLPVVLREGAVSDLTEIYRYITDQSGYPEQAWRFVQRIRTRCERIGDVPHGGRPRDGLAPGLRTVPFERSAVIAYMVEDHQVRVTNVFYGGRDYEALYGNADSEE